MDYYKGTEVTIHSLADAFKRSGDYFQDFCATLEEKHGLISDGLDPLARIVKLLECTSAGSQPLSQYGFGRTLTVSLSVGQAALHVGFESYDGSGQWSGKIDSVIKAVKWVLNTEGHFELKYLYAIAIKENCENSQDLLLNKGVDIAGKKAFTQEEFYTGLIDSADVRQF
jgi:hypothetical protein